MESLLKLTILFKIFFMYIYICVTVSVYVHQIHARALREERVSDLLEAELQLVVRHHMGSGK